MHRVIRQALPMTLGDFVAEDRADDSIDVGNRQCGGDFFALLDRRFADVEQMRDIERLLQAVILCVRAIASDFRAHWRRVEQLREVDALGLPMIDGVTRFKNVRAAHHLDDGAEAELSHEFTHFLSDEFHEVHGMLRITGEIGAQTRILSGDADRAGIQMANAHHDATERDKRSGGKAKFFRAKQCGDDNIPASLELTVRFHRDA